MKVGKLMQWMKTLNQRKLNWKDCAIIVSAALGLTSTLIGVPPAPPGPGTYLGKRCLDGTDGYEPLVLCAVWNQSWCTFSGQACNGCYPNAPDNMHQACKRSNNHSDICTSFGKGAFCGEQENRRCTEDGEGGFTCNYQSTQYGNFCSRWKCMNGVPEFVPLD